MTTNQSPALSGEELDKDSGASMRDVVVDLREFASNAGYSHNDYADTMRDAANCIEALRARFWNCDHLARAARQAQPVDAGVQASTSPARMVEIANDLEDAHTSAVLAGEDVDTETRNRDLNFARDTMVSAKFALREYARAALAQAAPSLPLMDKDDVVSFPGDGKLAVIHAEYYFKLREYEDAARAAVVAAADCHESCGHIGAECDYPACKIAIPAPAEAQPAGAPTVSLIEAAQAFVQYAEDCDEDCIQLDNLKAALAAQPAGAGAPSIDTPVFRELLLIYAGERANETGSFADEWNAVEKIIAHIDAQLVRQGAAPAQAEPVAGDMLIDFNKWMAKRGPLGAGAAPERIFFAGWSAGNRASTPAHAGVAQAWSKAPPTEQADYWHWDGDEDHAPMIYHVLWSGTAKKCFVSSGQYDITSAIFCDDFGGWWLKIDQPSVRAAIQASSNTGSEG